MTNPPHAVRLNPHGKGFLLPLATFAFRAHDPLLAAPVRQLDPLGAKEVNSTFFAHSLPPSVSPAPAHALA